MAGKECADAGPLLADPRKHPGVGHRIGPASAKFDGHMDAEQSVFARQRHNAIVESMREVAFIFDWPQRPAEGFDVVEQFFAVGRIHG